MRAQGKEELHQVQAGTEQNGELFIVPVVTATHDYLCPWTSGNDHFLAKQKMPVSERNLC